MRLHYHHWLRLCHSQPRATCSFGSTDEVGLFELTRGGLQPLLDPGVFLEERGEGAAARATGIVLEGNRPIFIEVQARDRFVGLHSARRWEPVGGLCADSALRAQAL